MNISAINAYKAVVQTTTHSATPAPPNPAESTFGNMLAQAVGDLGSLQQHADSAMLQVASGQPVELHEVMLAMEEATIGVQFAMQVRGKIIEAYQDIMRTQI